jgi:hypothetical protein
MNKLLLKSIMALHGDSVPDLAELIGKTPQTVYNKMNEYEVNGKKQEFTQGEITIIAEHYKMTAEQLKDVFFTEKVS